MTTIQKALVALGVAVAVTVPTGVAVAATSGPDDGQHRTCSEQTSHGHRDGMHGMGSGNMGSGNMGSGNMGSGNMGSGNMGSGNMGSGQHHGPQGSMHAGR